MIRAILTDIEGTTSSISFVKDVLFPYARRALPDFIAAHADEPAVAAEIDATRREMGASEASLDEVVAQLQRWIDEDRKITPLKTLQGLIWAKGYQSGDYYAHVYPDAADKLRAWHAEGLALYVYSSGSIAAQKLFFAHTEAGDLLPLFSGHFDTTSGPKQAENSYRAIVAAIGLPASEILFLSDVEAELDAAKAAGLHTTWLVRPEDRNPTEAELAAAQHPAVRSFADIRV